MCRIKVKLCVKVKPFVSLYVHALPGKAIPEMTYTVSGGTLNPTHSLILGSTHSLLLVDVIIHQTTESHRFRLVEWYWSKLRPEVIVHCFGIMIFLSFLGEH